MSGQKKKPVVEYTRMVLDDDDAGLRSTGLFFCDGNVISRNQLSDNSYQSKKRLCGTCGHYLMKKTHSCKECGQLKAPINPKHKSSQHLNVITGNGTNRFPEISFEGSISRDNISECTLQTLSPLYGKEVNTKKDMKMNIHSYPEWAGALVVFGYHSHERKANPQRPRISNSYAAYASGVLPNTEPTYAPPLPRGWTKLLGNSLTQDLPRKYPKPIPDKHPHKKRHHHHEESGIMQIDNGARLNNTGYHELPPVNGGK